MDFRAKLALVHPDLAKRIATKFKEYNLEDLVYAIEGEGDLRFFTDTSYDDASQVQGLSKEMKRDSAARLNSPLESPSSERLRSQRGCRYPSRRASWLP